MIGIDQETVKAIVGLVADGKSFRAIGRIDGMPSQSGISRLYVSDDNFRRMVDNARAARRSGHLAQKTSEFPTPERQRKGGVVLEAVDRNLSGTVIQTRARATVTTRLDWYLSRGVISRDMHRAGERISEILFRAGKSPRVCVMFRERVQGLNGNHGLDEKTEAQISLDEALAVLDSSEKDAIWDVCALDNFANKPRALSTGLRALVVHFRIRSDSVT